jgi:hypothetical protein
MKDQKRDPEVTLDVGPQEEGGKLTLAAGTPVSIRFSYPALSQGMITKLGYSEETGFEAEGTLTSTRPLLRGLTLGVRIHDDTFVVTAGLDPKKARPLFPGFKVTRSELGIQLAPEFKPYGTLAFEAGPTRPGGRPLIEGTVDVTADTAAPGGEEGGGEAPSVGSLRADGKLYANLPGVERAEGTVTYAQDRWSGVAHIGTSDIKGLPAVKDASVDVAFADGRVDARGAVTFEFYQQTVVASVQKVGGRIIYAGRASVTVPGLPAGKPADLAVTYDGTSVKARGKAAIQDKDLSGTLDIVYDDGKFSGEGRAELRRGKVRGAGTVRLSDQGKVSAAGELQYPLTERLIATVGFVLDERGRLTTRGELRFPQPIELFKGFGDNRELLRATIPVPIPGASVATVGLQFQIVAGLGIHYQVGPGVLRDLHLAGQIDPLEDNLNAALEGGGRLEIPARAGVSGSISGRLALDVKLVEVSGGLTVTVSADLAGGFFADVMVAYQNRAFTVDAAAGIEAGLVLGLDLDADVMLRPVVGDPLRKTWSLASYTYDTGLKFGLKAPIHYASNETFRAPSLSDIQLTLPSLDPQTLVTRAVGQAPGKEEKVPREEADKNKTRPQEENKV